MLRLGIALFAVAAVLAAPVAAAAGGGSDCDQKNDPTCLAWSAGNSTGASGDNSSGGCTWNGKPMPCTDPDFGWYMGGGCYWKAIEPPPRVPPPSGQDPSKGAWGTQSCYEEYGQSYATQVNYWMPAPRARVAPADLAQQALAKIHLLGARIGMEPDPAGSGLVGLPVWLWTAVTPGTWGPLSASASGGGITVTITARADRIVWDMGDGHSVTCRNPGTAYRTADGSKASPTCGYAYASPSSTVAHPGGRFTVTATTYWDAKWSGGGQAGVLHPTSRSQTSVQIGELQVVSQ